MGNRQRALPSTSPSVGNLIYTFDTPRHQQFSFRSPIIKYILKNPTGKAWQKLILTCKYFFLKYPVFPVKQLKTFNRRLDADGEELDRGKIIPQLWLFNDFDCYCVLADEVSVSKVISKIVKCNLRILRIRWQDLTWENYNMLTSSGSIRELNFYDCTVKYPDGKDVTMDKLLENVDHIESFSIECKWESKMFEKDTVKKIAKLLTDFKNLRCFELWDIDETFDLTSLMDFFMKNKTIDICLIYAEDLNFSDAYKQMLENCFGQLLENLPKKLPKICVYSFESLQYQKYDEIVYGKH